MSVSTSGTDLTVPAPPPVSGPSRLETLGPPRTADTGPDRDSGRLGPLGLAALLVGGFGSSFTFGAANIVLPLMTRQLHVGQGAGDLIIAAFGLAFAVVLILGGRLGDRYGRRRVFGLGLAGFAVSSALVGVMPTFPGVLVARIAQGLAAGMMLPQVLATVQATTIGRSRVRALSLYTAANAGGTTVGQVLGGVIASADLFSAGWRPVFWATGLIAAAGLPLLAAVPRTRSERTTGQDPVGTALFALAVIGVLLPVTLFRLLGGAWWVLALVLVAAGALIAFWRWEGRVDPARALTPPAVIRHPAMVAGMICVSMFFTGYGAFVYVFSLTVENGMGYSARGAGLALAPFALAFLVGALTVPTLTPRFGSVRLMRFGAVVQGSSLLVVALLFVTVPNLWLLQPVLIAMGLGQTLMFTPMLGAVVAAVPKSVAGLSGGIFSTLQQLWLALGVALLGLLFAVVNTRLPGWGIAACVVVQAVLAGVFWLLAPRTQQQRAD